MIVKEKNKNKKNDKDYLYKLNEASVLQQNQHSHLLGRTAESALSSAV